MSNFSKNGIAYCVIFSFGKAPLLTMKEMDEIALANWNISIYNSERGRLIGIRSLQRLNTEFIYTVELNIHDLMERSKPAILRVLDKKVNLGQ